MKYTFGLIFWAIGVWVSKRVVSLLPAHDRQLYARFLARKRAARTANIQAGNPQKLKQISFWIYCQPTQDQRVEKTLLSLAAQSSSNWRVRLVNHGHSGWIASSELKNLWLSFNNDSKGTGDIDWEHELQEKADWDCFLQAGDELETDFLRVIEHYCQKYPKAKLFYFDEGPSLCDFRQSCLPWLKPDWSPEALYSKNLLQRAVFSRQLLAQASSYHSRETGASLHPENGWHELWDQLAYTIVETIGKDYSPWQGADTQEIVHIPEVLCRVVADLEEDGSRRLRGLQAHLARRGLQAPQAIATSDSQIRVRWAVSDQLVSIIIPTQDHLDELSRSLNSIYAMTAEPPFEVILVDNQSTDAQTVEYYRHLEKAEQARVFAGGSDFNFSAFCNLGAREARGDLLLFLNNDVEIIDADWLHELVQFAILPEVGMVGGCLLYPERTIQHAGIIIGLEGHAGHIFQGQAPDTEGPFGSARWYRNYLAVTGACMCLRREVFEQIGGFDEAYHLAFSDVELGLRTTRAGYRVVYNPFARLVHFEGRSRQKRIPAADIHLGSQHLGEVVAGGDPYFNSGLSHLVSNPTLLCPIIERESPIERLKKIEQWYG